MLVQSFTNLSHGFQRILENYEVADPRERIARKIPFIHFVQFCLKYRIPIPSPTSFGRFVTSAYPRVKRSRLGKRTDVQYVYLGLRQRVLPLPETVAQPTTPFVQQFFKEFNS